MGDINLYPGAEIAFPKVVTSEGDYTKKLKATFIRKYPHVLLFEFYVGHGKFISRCLTKWDIKNALFNGGVIHLGGR